MADIVEQLLNWFGPVILGAIFIEWGASYWRQNAFSKRNLWAIFLIALGVRLALKGVGASSL